MRNKRIIIFGGLAILCVVYVVSIIPNFRHRSELNEAVRALRGVPRERLASAVDAFVSAQKAKAGAVSDTVSLSDLVASGFFRADEAAPFSGMDVTFNVGVDETSPQQILVRVRLRSGAAIVQLADGSIAQVTRAALDREDHK